VDKISQEEVLEIDIIAICMVEWPSIVTGQLLIDKNEDFLDATLAQLRDRDRFASGNYSYG
jgi:hypothetical protein